MPIEVGADMLETRKHYRSVLRGIKDTICRLETDHINQHDAEKAGIQLRSMSLEPQSDNPHFFIPFQEEYKHFNDDVYPTYDSEDEIRANVGCLHQYMQDCVGSSYPKDDNKPVGVSFGGTMGQLGLGTLAEWENHHWGVSMTLIATARDEPLPHMKCMMESELDGDDRLLRGELVAIIRTMATRLRTRSLRPHVMAPVNPSLSLSPKSAPTWHAVAEALLIQAINQVMMYSFMGPQQLRVLEAYFNGKNLVVRKTKLYDMAHGNTATIDLLCRWWIGFAVGDTKPIKGAPLP